MPHELPVKCLNPADGLTNFLFQCDTSLNWMLFLFNKCLQFSIYMATFTEKLIYIFSLI